MHLTKKAISERIKEIDVVIELLDARLPGSSANPMLAELTGGKPALKVLNKQDLADPTRTPLWLEHYNSQPGTRAIGLDASMSTPAKALIEACHLLAPTRGSMVKPMRVLICDTPGMLWPRIIVAKSGYNLAASGAIGRNAFNEEEVALELLDYLIPNYPDLLKARYKVELPAGTTDEQLLEEIGRKRGAVLSKGRINLQKAAEIVIYEFRQSTLGRITLETPQEFAQWLAAGQKLDAERQVKKDEIELKRLVKLKKVPRPAKVDRRGNED